MVDRVDVNVQALGVLAHAVGDTARNLEYAAGSHGPVDSGPAHVNAVADHVHAFGQSMPGIPFEIFGDEKTRERAWQHPYLGGDLDIAREIAGLTSQEIAFSANAKAVHTIEQTTGAVLNLFA